VSNFEIGLLFFAILILLILLRMPIALAMLLVGGAGYALVSGWQPLMAFLKTSVHGRAASESLSVIPLFVLMGQFAIQAGLTRSLFEAARAWLGHWRGGLAIAAIGSCAAFGTICGSSTATAATMAHIALPELKRHGYSDSLSTGTLAAGGSLGILIPPSITLIIYAVLVEQSILDLFRAAVIPGILAVVGYILVIAVTVRISPMAGAALPKLSWPERISSLADVWPVAAIFLLMMGGIYLGWFSVTEGASVGVVATGLFALLSGNVRWAGFRTSILETAKITGFLFLILIGAEVYNSFLALTQIPTALADWIRVTQLDPILTVVLMILVYLVLGCVMDALAMILLTVPVFAPVLVTLDLGLSPDAVLVWFGIIALIVTEIGLITPPIGLNVFIISSLAPKVRIGDIFKGAFPFVISDLVRVAIIVALPLTALWVAGLK
jgi:tripartite ATP-independent transporter DctM subunit